MTNFNFIQIYDNTVKSAEKFLNAPSDARLLEHYETYASGLKQLTQILRKIKDKESISSQIENLLKIHERVEERLVTEKESLFKTIRKTLCQTHVRHKYYTDNIKSSLVDRKF